MAKSSTNISKFKQYDHSVYRLNISYITGFGTFPVLPKGTKRAFDVCPGLDQLKAKVLDTLILHQNKRRSKLEYYSIAWQVHPGSGLPHLDILLAYESNVKLVLTSFDYLIKQCQITQEASSTFTPGHVWVTPYSSTKFSLAILDYGQKEDPVSISNITADSKHALLRTHWLKKNPYRYLQLQMLKDPLHFSLQQYVRSNDLNQYLSSWTSLKTRLKDSQVAAANLALRSKQGFKYINRTLIEANLNSQQLKVYDSWPGYQTIVDYLNQIVTYGYKRPMKTMNLLITGAPNTGKTSLFSNRYPRVGENSVSNYCSVYPMGTKTWWPNYRSQIYGMILWNQAKLTSYSYDTILKVLQGSQVDLAYKGGSVLKYDNPLVVMTSNLTLQQMIQQKFGYDRGLQDMARKNLAVRIQNLIIPEEYNLFLLQKLLTNFKTHVV